jgi:cell division protein FtsX
MPGVSHVLDLRVDPVPPFSVADEIAVFLCTQSSSFRCQGGKESTPAQVKAIDQALRGIREIESFRFEDQAEAFARMREQHTDNEELMKALRERDMPRSFRIRLVPEADGADRERVADMLARMPGVSQVVDQRCSITLSTLFRRFGFIPDSGKEICAR